MHKILVLWAVPRSTSTAFEWMMRQRGDMQCFHEPFGEAWYQGVEPLWPRLTADSLRTPGLTLDSVLANLTLSASRGPVFSKDFPHYADHMWNDKLLSQFKHSFLIRDPAKRFPPCMPNGQISMRTKLAFSSSVACLISYVIVMG